MIIKSGSIDNTSLVINSNGEATVHAHTFCSKEISAISEIRYNMGSGPVTLTSDAESALFYFKNTENYDFVITNIFANLGVSTGGAGGVAQVKVYFNPTAGTLISGASVASAPNNFYIGSSNELSGVFFKGVTGSTITAPAAPSLVHFSGLITQDNIPVDGIVIPKGKAVAVSIVPPAGNTSLLVYAGLTGYISTPVMGNN